MTFRDAELRGNLAAAPIAYGPEVDDLTLTLVEHLESARQSQSLVAHVEGVTRPLSERCVVLRSVRAPGGERPLDVLLVDSELASHFCRGWRPLQGGRQFGLALDRSGPELLGRPRHPDRCVRSRRCRLISPTMFGTANAASSPPRLRSKRSIALMSPMQPA